MRGFLFGLFILLLASPAFAQATGEVKVIGFNGTFRSTGWTSMVVSIKPQTNEAGNYEVRVIQHDLDGDRPVYVHPISLTGANAAPRQDFWMYFQTEPIHNGLGFNINSIKDLQKDLTVFLTSPGGKTVISKLPLTSTVTDIDPVRSNSGGKVRPTRLVLVVTANGGKQIPLGAYNDAVGVAADIEAITVRPEELPDNPLGYEGVDAVVWLDGDPVKVLASNGSQTLPALQDYVKFGGHLVITQSINNWQEDTSFGDMMPVDVSGVDHKTTMEPLLSMSVPPVQPDPFLAVYGNGWVSPTGPFQMARAKARTGAVVEDWIDWKEDNSNLDVTPWLARKGYGLGQVTWVAQSLSSDAVPLNPTGWPYIWNHIFGWPSDAYVLPPKARQDDSVFKLNPITSKPGENFARLKRYEARTALDLGNPLVQGLNLGSKGAWLIFLAVIFFLAYWVVAGPGSYIFLAVKKKRGLSWFIFGASALVATALTIGVVKLVLRGPPEVKHITFYRSTAGQPTIVWSKFGLYIPRDGEQTLTLSGTTPTSVSYISPMPEHPQQLGNIEEFAVPLDYEVPVRELKSDTDPTLTVPYRSSLKKFQARWVGDSPAGFAGNVKLDLSDPAFPLAGTMTNNTGVNLSDVYLIFNTTGTHDWAIYLPNWAAGVSVNIKKDWAPTAYQAGTETDNSQVKEARAGDSKIISDELVPDKFYRVRSDGSEHGQGWAGLWFDEFRRKGSSMSDAKFDDTNYNHFFPVLSVFSRLPPMPNRIGTGHFGYGTDMSSDRVDLQNRGSRDLDCGPAIGAGRLVVIGSAKGPLPINLQVNGSKVEGEGTTFYQFIVPMDRGPIQTPTTHPSPIPTTAPAAAK